jgi:peptidoglycan/LPS O-acetylase OafA/YrhL
MRLFTIDTDPDRVYGLDIVRAAAILCVVYVHGFFLLGGAVPPKILKYLGIFIPDALSVFFVLSGYLIGGILIRHLERSPATGANLRRFWIRRWCRTLPNYYLILVVLTVYHMQVSGLEFAAVWKYFFFLQNVDTPHPQFFAEAWSLAVEEWFYLLVPILLFVGVRAGLSVRQAVIGVVLLVIVGSLAVRGYRYYFTGIHSIMELDLVLRKQVVTRLDSLIWGVLGAAIHYYHGNLWRWRPRLTFAAGLATLTLHNLLFTYRDALGLTLNLYYCVFSFTLVAVGALLILPFLSGIQRGEGVIYRWVTVVSITSFSMYLIHLNLVQFILVPASVKLLPVQLGVVPLALLKLALYWTYTILGSILLYKYFEMPTTALRRFVGDDRARAPAAAGTAVRQRSA